jgi:hypothetical protein
LQTDFPREAAALNAALEARRHVVLKGKSTLLHTVADAVGLGLVFV